MIDQRQYWRFKTRLQQIWQDLMYETKDEKNTKAFAFVLDGFESINKGLREYAQIPRTEDD